MNWLVGLGKMIPLKPSQETARKGMSGGPSLPIIPSLFNRLECNGKR